MKFVLASILMYLFTTVTIYHDVESTSYVDNGEIQYLSSVDPNAPHNAIIVINYHLDLKWPFPNQNGTLQQNVPSSFLTETFYAWLRSTGQPYNYEGVTMKFINMYNVFGMICYGVHIKKHDNSWEAMVFYNPTIPGVGWKRVSLKMNNIPIIGSHIIHSNLR